MSQTPSIGRIVHLKLGPADVQIIEQRRASAGTSGNPAREGDIFPAMIVRVWGDQPTSAVQLQVFLDGTDTHWATSRVQGAKPGQWSWPPRA